MASQGLISMARGDGFVQGAVSGFIGKISGPILQGIESDVTSSVIAGVFGGVASKATGGDFLQGALQAATVHLYNQRGEKAAALQKAKQFAGWFWDDLKSGVVRDRIMLAVNAELSIAAGLAEGALTYTTGGTAGAFIGMHGAGNLAGGIGDYLDIFDGGSRDWNFTRQGYENIFTLAGQDASGGARAFYFTDAAIGVGALFSPVSVNYVGPLTITGQTTVPAFTRTNPVILTHDAVQIGSAINSGASN